ncbi:MAG: bifunctional metallophosphatase/5'-nucleotidase [Candidatus Aminicenantes bacterium]|nr:bifunctional metallophosphatase/5'-nucleotidase [Candidatus Aminicenantes bacterium]
MHSVNTTLPLFDDSPIIHLLRHYEIEVLTMTVKAKRHYLFSLFAAGWWFVFLSVCPLIHASAAFEPKKLTIIHTNDLHSHLLGHSPNWDYTPETVLDDDTQGGWARIATVIQGEKQARDHPVLVLDAGDFLMGTLFHMISREQAVELMLMKKIGFDFTTLGNHEFDLKPSGLSRILRTAQSKAGLPGVLASNLIFDPDQEEDDALEQDFKQGLINPYAVIERNGIRIGIFGLLGKDASETAPFAWPVTFADIVESSNDMVRTLRDEENVDMVVCLSHSGIWDEKKKSEDEILAKKVPGIDIIISGHTHTRVTEPIFVNDTVIVQADSYGKFVGILDVAWDESETVLFENYRLTEINDSIKGNERINQLIQENKELIESRILKDRGLQFYQPLAETGFDLCIEDRETGLGNLITDALRRAVNKRVYDPARPLSRVRVALQSNGLIRSDIVKGQTGVVGVSDLFRVVPLGIGVDDTMSYPVLTFYLYASEIKKAMEVATSIYPAKGSDYFLQFSGLKVIYNPKRMIFDRVTDIWIEEQDGTYRLLDTSRSNQKLYRVTSNFFNSSFIKFVGDYTKSILKMVPKDADGNPIKDLGTARVDADPDTSGIQELKDWETLFEYMDTFEDSDGNGIKEIPQRYSQTEDRYVAEPSLNPVDLLKGGTFITWGAFGAVLVVLGIFFLVFFVVLKKIKKRRQSRQ